MQDRTLGTILILIAGGVLVGVAFWFWRMMGGNDGVLSEPVGGAQTPDDIEAQRAFKTACAKSAALARVRGVSYRNWKRDNPACAFFITRQEYDDLDFDDAVGESEVTAARDLLASFGAAGAARFATNGNGAGMIGGSR